MKGGWSCGHTASFLKRPFACAGLTDISMAFTRATEAWMWDCAVQFVLYDRHTGMMLWLVLGGGLNTQAGHSRCTQEGPCLGLKFATQLFHLQIWQWELVRNCSVMKKGSYLLSQVHFTIFLKSSFQDVLQSNNIVINDLKLTHWKK